ncbi:hypothetical protein Tco_0695073 [Tanacetum coccineum]
MASESSSQQQQKQLSPTLNLNFELEDAVPLDGLHFDDKLQFVEEPIEIIDREVKRLKRSRTPLVKVRWNYQEGS